MPIVHASERASKTSRLKLIVRPKAAVWIIRDGHEDFLTPSEVADPQTREAVTRALAKATTIVAANIRALVKWPQQERVIAISMLASSRCAAFYCRWETDDPSTSLTEALTKYRPDAADGPAYEQWLRPCLEAMALGSELQIEPGCAKVKGAAKELGVAVTISKIRRLVGDVRKGLRLDTGGLGQRVLADVVTNLLPSVPANVLVPRGWTMSDTGVYRPGEAGAVQVVPVPLFLSELHRNVGNGSHFVTVTWRRNAEWVERTVPRTMVANKQAIVGLAEYGAPVNSDNAGNLVKFLADFEHTNAAILAETMVSSQLGWQGTNGQHGFLLGREHIVAGPSPSETETEGSTPASKIVFRGSDHGNDQVAECFSRKGDMKTWMNAVRELSSYPRIMLGLYAGFGPPLLDIVEAPNVTLDYAAESSTGKTFAIRINASPWGCVEISDPRSIVKSFNGTLVWMERLLTVSPHLPTFLDDTKNALHKEQITQLIYNNSQGRGKGRGSKEGLQEQQAWRTVLSLTGEESATSYSRDGGSRPRTLSIWGSPFGECSEQVAKLIRRTNEVLRDNYGTAGHEYVRYLVQHREADQAKWRDRFNELVKVYDAKAGQKHFVRRQAPNFAVILLAAEIAHLALRLPWKLTNPIDLLWGDLTREVSGADQAAEALRAAIDWATSNQNRFFCRSGGKVPPGGWLGRWHGGKNQGWEWIGFLREPLTTFLDSRGFNGGTMIQIWHDRSWLHVSKDDKQKRRAFRAIVDREPTWLIAIKREAIEKVGEDSHS
jgi:putative DNA primase/helicase